MHISKQHQGKPSIFTNINAIDNPRSSIYLTRFVIYLNYVLNLTEKLNPPGNEVKS